MIVVGLIFAGIAALVHLYIFYLESLAWESPQARAVFGTGSVEEARATRFLAYNQGFYNLFLAILAALGIIFVAVGHLGVGSALVFAGTGSMLAAALVLFVSSKPHRSAAVKQGLFPLLAVGALAIGLLV
ncbi:DUF1304 domain-containing protein [Hoyosella rhizosphaerae]|uniref:Membrane protein n=1 Tax=Hoyosella rhizosphaerae TaxID=1755582 RepID=A0A916U0R1_9ACTN|nr:DUF1304 domain-containing protein [Hoyosella rhizosphaerae]MBN4927169.1 DUF1304 domain-containing protein [Hoyosella rhizosphaerae]GGC53469.1 membrane protein [Hoyosella rhizosphaerae]